jgi:hypothetical protein
MQQGTQACIGLELAKAFFSVTGQLAFVVFEEASTFLFD